MGGRRPRVVFSSPCFARTATSCRYGAAMAPRRGPFRLEVEASHFPRGSGLNRTSSLSLGWEEVLWASMTVGKAPKDLLRHGRYSVAEMVHRVSCLSAYYQVRMGRLALSTAFKDLDPSEKGIVSYYTGMAMAKVYAHRALNVPWLMHISRYATDWSVGFGAGGSRPDLFGCSPRGDWVVAEAKGRNRVGDQLLNKMISQKQAVSSINGAPPLHAFGSATRIRAGQVSLRVVDPPSEQQGLGQRLDPAIWLADYYAPIVDLVGTSDLRQDGDLLFGRVPGTEVDVGLSQVTIDALRRTRERAPRRPHPEHEQRGPGRGEIHDLLGQSDAESRDLTVAMLEGAERGRHRDGYDDGVVIRTPLA